MESALFHMLDFEERNNDTLQIKSPILNICSDISFIAVDG